MEADRNDIKRAYSKLARFLSKMNEVVEKETIEPARQHIRNASEVFAMANADEDPYSSVKYMDQALSYIHHAINDLLLGRKAKLHSPADYQRHYDIILPVKEDL